MSGNRRNVSVWVEKLIDRVGDKNKEVSGLMEQLPWLTQDVQGQIEKDVEDINREIYGGEGVLLVVPHSLESGDFRVMHNRSHHYANLQLDINSLELTCSFQPGGSVKAWPVHVVGYSSEVVIGKSGHEISVEELSRQIIEPLVRHDQGL